MLRVFGKNVLLYLEKHIFPSNIRSKSHIGPSFMENEVTKLLLLSM